MNLRIEILESEVDLMKAEIQSNGVAYVGFNIEDNGKFIVETKGDWTYVNFQENEFAKIIFGYVVKQDDGKYKAFQLGTFETNFNDRNVKFFDSVVDGVEYIKSLKRD